MWSNVVEATREPGENHQTWTGEHYPATCPDTNLNLDRRGDKRVCYSLCYPGPQHIQHIAKIGMIAVDWYDKQQLKQTISSVNTTDELFVQVWLSCDSY